MLVLALKAYCYAGIYFRGVFKGFYCALSPPPNKFFTTVRFKGVASLFVATRIRLC